MFPYGVTATVRRPAGARKHGVPPPTVEHEVPDCAAAPAGSTEALAPASTVEWDVDLLCGDPDADFRDKDTVLLPGDPEEYHVHGKPQRFRNPFTGHGAGCVVRLKGAQG